MSLVIGILTFVLIITSLFLVVVVLMQRASDAGMGSAMGGGSMESTFGAETGNVLSGATIKASVIFFVVSFTLYLAHIYQIKHHDGGDTKLPTITAPASTSMLPTPMMPTAAPSSSTGPIPLKTATPSTGPVSTPSPSGSTGPVPQPSHPVEPKK